MQFVAIRLQFSREPEAHLAIAAAFHTLKTCGMGGEPAGCGCIAHMQGAAVREHHECVKHAEASAGIGAQAADKIALGVGGIMALMLWVFPAAIFAQSSCPGIHVKILDIRNSTGAVACALFESSEGFPTEYLRSATHIMFIKVRDRQARCDFEDIPPGTYALAVVHDENLNGKLDVNWLKIPNEGYGFSNDAKALLGAPSFSAASFSYGGQNLELTIRLNY